PALCARVYLTVGAAGPVPGPATRAPGVSGPATRGCLGHLPALLLGGTGPGPPCRGLEQQALGPRLPTRPRAGRPLAPHPRGGPGRREPHRGVGAPDTAQGPLCATAGGAAPSTSPCRLASPARPRDHRP